MPVSLKSSVRVSIDPDVERRISDVAREKLQPVLGQLAAAIAGDAAAGSDFADKTGNLRKSITAEELDDGDGYIVTARAPHAHLIEFGHDMVSHKGVKVGQVKAHPFLRPAADRVMAQAARFFASLPPGGEK